MQQLVELARIDARDCLLARDEPLVDHLRRDAKRGGGRALARARLQDVQRPLLDRELDVLQIAVVRLEPVERLDELLEGLRHVLAHALDRLRRADSRDDVLALRVREELAIESPLAGRGVAGEAHARAGGVASVSEDHLDDVDGGAEVVRDVVRAPIHPRARSVPGVEDGAIGAAQLVVGIVRKRVSGLLFVDRAEGGDELAQVVGRELDVLGDATRSLEVCQRLFEAVPVDPVDHHAVHLDQPAVRVECEARVSRRGGETLDRDVVQPQVEDRVHHPGHRDRGARADGDQERIGGVAEALSGALLEGRDPYVDLVVEPRRHLTPTCQESAARLGRDREPVGNRDAESSHLGEADPLPPEELPSAARVLGEVEDVAHLRGESTGLSRPGGIQMGGRCIERCAAERSPDGG